RRRVAIGVAGTLLAAVVTVLVLRAALAPPLAVAGPRSGSVLGGRAVAHAAVASSTTGVSFLLDGKDVTAVARRTGDSLSLRRLPDGAHVVEVRTRAGFLGARTVRRI